MARILVIEDNPTNLELMVYLLQAFGHSTFEALDGVAGLEAARREVPDLILCDVDLPKMDGLQVARAIKLDSALRSIPIVAVTALAMVGDRDRMLQAGFDGYLSKPIQPRDFVGQVEQFLPAAARGGAARPEPGLGEQGTPAAPPPPPTRGRVLVVDDRPSNLEVARSVLEPHGYAAVLASSVADALAEARREPPDLVLSDIHMPGNDGFTLLAALQADPRLRRIPFAFLSATSYGGEDQRRALAQGANAFLHRPIGLQALLAEVERLIGEGREGGG